MVETATQIELFLIRVSICAEKNRISASAKSERIMSQEEWKSEDQGAVTSDDENPLPSSSDSVADESAEQGTRAGLTRAWMYGAVAMEFTFSVVGGGVGGYLLDKQLKTSPVWTLALLVLGFVGGLVFLIRGLQVLDKDNS